MRARSVRLTSAKFGPRCMNFGYGVGDWRVTHVGYTQREAKQALRPGATGASGRLFSSDPTKRPALKWCAARLPARYFLRLFYMVVLKQTFLDGVPGMTYVHMLATYEAMVEIHLRVLRHGTRV